jgi:uncharacterized protein
MTEKTALLVFVKYPIEGKVKTRLASGIGSHWAKEVYSIIASNIVNETLKIKNVNLFCFYSGEDEAKIKNWVGNDFIYYPQTGLGLGEKMENAFKKVFEMGNEKIIIIGTDIPNLNSGIIEHAITKLHNSDFVIGPSNDGGYYLLGMKKFSPFVFRNIEYSTDRVFENTIKKIKESGLSYSVTGTLQDIDTENDLKRWLENNTESIIHLELNKIYSDIKK